MISVFAFGTSTPVSMIVVQTRMSISCSISRRQISESSCSLILPWPMPMRASGTRAWMPAATRSMEATSLCR